MNPKRANRPEFDLPVDTEAEQGLLGALMLDNRLIATAAAELEARHFFHPLHQRLYRMIVYLPSEDEAVNPLTLFAVMRTDAGLLEMGGRDYLAELAKIVPIRPDVKAMARILIELSRRRELVEIAVELSSDAIDVGRVEMPAHKAAAKAADKLLGLSIDRRAVVKTVAESAQETLKETEERSREKHEGRPVGISTGLSRLDAKIGGMLATDRIGIAARSMMGKTAVLGSIVLSAARQQAPVLVMSADMVGKRFSQRLICDMDLRMNPTLDPIPYGSFRRADFTEDQWTRVVLATQELQDLPIHIDDAPAVTLSYTRGRATALARQYEGRVGILAFDFLQKGKSEVDARMRDRRRDEELSDFAYGLGDIAKDLGWISIDLIQLKNRDTDSKGRLIEEEPNEAHIRESGGIIAAHDILFAVHRESYFIERREPSYDADPVTHVPCGAWKTWNAEMHLAKHKARLIGFKNRDDSPRSLNIDLWCDLGANAFRDDDPKHPPDVPVPPKDDLLSRLRDPLDAAYSN